jgi:hypothetical protein
MFDALLYLALSMAGLVTVICGITARKRGIRTVPHFALATALYVAAGLIALHAGNVFYAGVCAGSVTANAYMWWDGGCDGTKRGLDEARPRKAPAA